jgi:16S rRNA (uracil1498-N3)-methyltransferase
MQLPYFYVADLNGEVITLDEDRSKHVAQVLRMQKGEQLMMADGKGKLATGEIVDDHRKKCQVLVKQTELQPETLPSVTIAISLLKNTSRFEWFLEKATEIGINRIIPLICDRTEKQKFRQDRLHSILESAMVQSRQCWLPELTELVSFAEAVKENADHRFIAHCVEEEKTDLSTVTVKGSSIILIGPEGDFSAGEIETALLGGFAPVSLGSTRLRTETAGMVAAVLLASRRSSIVNRQS